MLIPKYKNYSSDLINILNKPQTVKESFVKIFEDMEIRVLYLEEIEGVNNPYLAKHFIKL